MDVLLAGATGATGSLLLNELLDRGHSVRAIVRSADRLPEGARGHEQLHVVEADLLEMSDGELQRLVAGCEAIVSCLGHNLSFKGIYGKPRRLVTDATRRLCDAAMLTNPVYKTRFVLMNTTGNRNRDLGEHISFAQACVIQLLRLLVPPHPDNEEAAEHLRTRIGQRHPRVEWVVVRPDALIDKTAVTSYELHPSPTSSAIFNSGKTSRINVAHFMAELVSNDELWRQWRGRMPVIYNK
jgi:nucleoside-diphosphate-sugar epimerase